MKILITGGAGFVGSQLALKYRERSYNHKILVMDNLRRRGAELNLRLFKKHNIEFLHGDVRHLEDFPRSAGNFDLVIDASAEPSVLAGLDGNPQYVTHCNLLGTLNSLEFVRKHGGQLIFLSTSRVYSIGALQSIALKQQENRFVHQVEQIEGLNVHGISENFCTKNARSLYGASKLASELFIQEYIDTYNLSAVINRCGVIAGAGQFGKADQGVFTLWVANHYFNQPLNYTGFGGKGLQVRDLLHPNDLFDLIKLQVNDPKKVCGEVYNIGGGMSGSISLAELTLICQQVTENTVDISHCEHTNKVDIPWYVTDCAKVTAELDWRPTHSVNFIVEDIHQWIINNRSLVEYIFVN